MKIAKALYLAPLILGLPLLGGDRDKSVQLIAKAISTLEGWGNPKSLVRKLNNPGALVCSGWYSSSCDRSGYSRFDSPAAGWRALQLDLHLKLRRGTTIRKLSKGHRKNGFCYSVFFLNLKYLYNS